MVVTLKKVKSRERDTIVMQTKNFEFFSGNEIEQRSINSQNIQSDGCYGFKDDIWGKRTFTDQSLRQVTLK